MMRFRLYSFMLTFLLSLSFGWSQNSYHADSVIISLIENRDVFELENAYNEIGQDLSPVWKLFCEAELAKAFGRRDKHSELLIEFLKTYDTNLKEEFKEQVYRMLFQNIIETGNKSHYHWGCEKISQYIENNPDSLTINRLSMYKKNISLVKERYAQNLSYPPIKICRGKPNQVIPLLSDSHPTILTEINNISSLAHIDTGCSSYLFLSKKKALEIGVRSYYKDVRSRNGEEVEFTRGIIDSIQIGALKLYNIPVDIAAVSPLKNLPDSLKENKQIKEKLKEQEKIIETPLIGLPLLTLIGQIKFNFKQNVLSFPQPPESQLKSIKHNLFTFQNQLYTRVIINNIPATLAVDTGHSLFITLPGDFYQENKSAFPVEEINTSNEIILSIYLHGTDVQKSFHFLKSPKIYFLGRKINENDKEKIAVRKEDYLTYVCFPYYDGVLGYSFIKSLAEVILFDFKNMVVTINEPKNDKEGLGKVKIDDN